MKTNVLSMILSGILAAYPVIGSAAGGAYAGSNSSSTSLNALTKTSSKLERRKRISTCFKKAMRNGVIPGTTDRIDMKGVVCSGGSRLIVATIPVSSLGEPEAQQHFEEAMNGLFSRSHHVDRPFGLLVDFIGDDFYAVYDASYFLNSDYGPISLIAAGGSSEFESLVGVSPENFAHVVQSLVEPQVFYSSGGTILKWTLAGAATGAAIGGGIGLAADAGSDGTANGNLDGRYGSIDNGSDSAADGAGWGAAIGGAIGAGVGFVVGVFVAIFDDDDDDEPEETEAE